jgi:arylsulfatase A-like enzyme
MDESLINNYNDLVDQARSLGVTGYRTVKRFRPANSGPTRIAEIENDIRAAQAAPAERDDAAATTGAEASVVEPAVESEQAATVEAEAAVEEPMQTESETMAKTAKTKTAAPKAAKAPKKAAAPKAAKAPKKAAAPKANKAKAVKEPAKRGRPPTNGVTIAAKTQEYNELVPAAKKKGVSWAKVHTSFFGSHVAADAQLKRIQDAIKAA